MESDITPKEKERLDKIISGIISQKWEPESCMQEFYSEFFVSPHYGFYHNGHEYFITIDADEKQKVIWVIYDRDLSDEKEKYEDCWNDEQREEYPDLPTLAFNYKLKNDGRSIADYICDYNKQEHLLMPEPVDDRMVRKVWKH